METTANTSATARQLTPDERALLDHITRWGSDGYPLNRLTSKPYGQGRTKGWTWSFRSIEGPPVVYKTKREAVASFEAYLEVLHEAQRSTVQRDAIRERLAAGQELDSIARLMVNCGAGEYADCLRLVRRQQIETGG